MMQANLNEKHSTDQTAVGMTPYFRRERTVACTSLTVHLQAKNGFYIFKALLKKNI